MEPRCDASGKAQAVEPMPFAAGSLLPAESKRERLTRLSLEIHDNVGDGNREALPRSGNDSFLEPV